MPSHGGVVSREAYLETGHDVLADRCSGGLELAEVCNRLGATTGSSYHYFASWPAYTKELMAHWMQARAVQVNEGCRMRPILTAASACSSRPAWSCRSKPQRRSVCGAPGRYLQGGYEQATLPLDVAGLRWIARQLRRALRSGRLASVPDGE